MPSATGRPRSAGPSPTGLGTRADILDAGAELFCTVGYGSVSTHALAARAGIRQASLYHYFEGKHAVLLELLLGTVSPSLDAARRLLATDAPDAARLWALCAADVGLLTSGQRNVGSLYLLPELEDERFAPFHALRDELEAAYESLVSGVTGASDGRGVAVLVLGLVESVILQRRREPHTVDTDTGPAIADAALKMTDVTGAALARARDRGRELLRSL